MKMSVKTCLQSCNNFIATYLKQVVETLTHSYSLGSAYCGERAVNVISFVADGLTPQNHLDGIILQLGDWHAAVSLLSVCRTLTLFPVEA